MEDEKKLRLHELASELGVSNRMINEFAERAGLEKLGPPLAFVTQEDADKIRAESVKYEEEIAKRVAERKGTTTLAPKFTEPQSTEPGKTFIFASRASELRLDNWIPETKGRDNGVVINSAGSLDFNDGLYVTTDPFKAAFIRNTDDRQTLADRQFRDGMVFEFDTMEQALRFRAEIKAGKQIREFHSQDVSNVNVSLDTKGLQNFQAEVEVQAKIG